MNLNQYDILGDHQFFLAAKIDKKRNHLFGVQKITLLIQIRILIRISKNQDKIH